jgi:hypothetical protein
VRAPFETNSSVNGHYKTSLVCDRIRGSEHHRQPRCLGVRQNLIGHLAGGPYITLSFANQTCSTSEFVPRNHENNACAKYSSTHSKYRKVRLRSCCGLRPVAVVAVGQHVAECTYAPVPDGRLRPEAPHTAVSATPRKVQQASARCRSALVLGGATHALSASSSETDASPPSPCPSTSIVSSRKRRSQSAHGRLELLGQVKRDRRGGTWRQLVGLDALALLFHGIRRSERLGVQYVATWLSWPRGARHGSTHPAWWDGRSRTEGGREHGASAEGVATCYGVSDKHETP